MEKQTQIFALLAKLELAFDKTLMPQQRKIYLEAIQDCRLDAINHAIGQSIAFEQRFPPVAKLREYAGNYRQANQLQIPRYSLADVKPTSEFGKAALANIRELFSEENPISKEAFLETAITLCQKYGEGCEDLQAQLYDLQPEPF